MRSWVVLLECVLSHGQPMGFPPEVYGALLEELSDMGATGLHRPDRYVVQVELAAGDPLAAISHVLVRHAEALRHVPLGGELARIDLLTSEEMERDLRDFLGSSKADNALEHLSGLGADPVGDAEAALDWITGPQDAHRVLSNLVRHLGGGVVAGRPEDEWMLAADIGFGGEARVPIAEPWSIARLRLEQALPPLIDKARQILSELEAARRADDRSPKEPGP